MARSRITDTSKEIMSDSGSVLLSIVKGEQLEFPVTLDFVDTANTDYSYEAALVEAVNDGAGTIPTIVEPGGVTNSLDVRLCTHRGDWVATTAYDREDVVDYDGDSYKLVVGSSYISSTTPDVDDLWELHDKRIVYVQFTYDLGAYSVAPTANVPVYGFFELAVSENVDTIFLNIWKPVRGLVEFLFSPTTLVP